MTQHFEQNKNMVLHEGEIYLIEIGNKGTTGDKVMACYSDEWTLGNSIPTDKRNWHKVIATTDPSLTGVKLLDRKHFVREVDVEEIANQAVIKRYAGVACADRGEMSEYHIGYRDSYNAKKGEYTESQMYDCALAFFYHWYNSPGQNTAQGLQEWLPKHIASLQTLSLPQSLTIENGNITKTEW